MNILRILVTPVVKLAQAVRPVLRHVDAKSLRLGLLGLLLLVLGARFATDRTAIVAYVAAQAAVAVAFLSMCRRAERRPATP